MEEASLEREPNRVCAEKRVRRSKVRRGRNGKRREGGGFEGHPVDSKEESSCLAKTNKERISVKRQGGPKVSEKNGSKSAAKLNQRWGKNVWSKGGEEQRKTTKY